MVLLSVQRRVASGCQELPQQGTLEGNSAGRAGMVVMFGRRLTLWDAVREAWQRVGGDVTDDKAVERKTHSQVCATVVLSEVATFGARVYVHC